MTSLQDTRCSRPNIKQKIYSSNLFYLKNEKSSFDFLERIVSEGNPALRSEVPSLWSHGTQEGGVRRREGVRGLSCSCRNELPSQPEDEKRSAPLLFVRLWPLPSVHLVPDTCTSLSELGFPVIGGNAGLACRETLGRGG